ncbi:hypothetical protein EYR40_006982 [Pleurotus pulmonarius]|nr:hypothetical protein EYR36_003741 [Pleurotus pulmonarius]KAF4598621.1 hypothetical protein EYR38_007027 [Pleurotus pulmonarius]KAF4599878.1 hypothetical protein EYR40_006982 [Pleurotus pulmonarius]
MCNYETEGTKYGCGHYKVTRKLTKRDCGNRYCKFSSRHAKPCPHCPTCEQYLGPDFKENVVEVRQEYCTTCHYWYEGEGARPRR